MNLLQKSIVIGAMAFGLPVSSVTASVALDIFIGALRSSSSTIVDEASLWAIVYDENDDGAFPGGLSQNFSLTEANKAQSYTDFFGKTIESGTIIGGDRILRVFEVNSIITSGVQGVAATSAETFDYLTEGLTADRPWAVYWFPGLRSGANQNILSTAPFEIGGFSSDVVDPGGDTGMVMPPDGFSYTPSFLDIANGGSFSSTRFTAIDAQSVPEPSSVLFLLGLLGAPLLLSRRRSA